MAWVGSGQNWEVLASAKQCLDYDCPAWQLGVGVNYLREQWHLWPPTDFFLGGLQVIAVDGTVLDVPDSQANARVFSYQAVVWDSSVSQSAVECVKQDHLSEYLFLDQGCCNVGSGLYLCNGGSTLGVSSNVKIMVEKI